MSEGLDTLLEAQRGEVDEVGDASPRRVANKSFGGQISYGRLPFVFGGVFQTAGSTEVAWEGNRASVNLQLIVSLDLSSCLHWSG